jgi:hypothetical protein
MDAGTRAGVIRKTIWRSFDGGGVGTRGVVLRAETSACRIVGNYRDATTLDAAASNAVAPCELQKQQVRNEMTNFRWLPKLVHEKSFLDRENLQAKHDRE